MFMLECYVEKHKTNTINLYKEVARTTMSETALLEPPQADINPDQGMIPGLENVGEAPAQAAPVPEAVEGPTFNQDVMDMAAKYADGRVPESVDDVLRLQRLASEMQVNPDNGYTLRHDDKLVNQKAGHTVKQLGETQWTVDDDTRSQLEQVARASSPDELPADFPEEQRARMQTGITKNAAEIAAARAEFRATRDEAARRIALSDALHQHTVDQEVQGHYDTEYAKEQAAARAVADRHAEEQDMDLVERATEYDMADREARDIAEYRARKRREHIMANGGGSGLAELKAREAKEAEDLAFRKRLHGTEDGRPRTPAAEPEPEVRVTDRTNAPERPEDVSWKEWYNASPTERRRLAAAGTASEATAPEPAPAPAEAKADGLDVPDFMGGGEDTGTPSKNKGETTVDDLDVPDFMRTVPEAAPAEARDRSRDAEWSQLFDLFGQDHRTYIRRRNELDPTEFAAYEAYEGERIAADLAAADEALRSRWNEEPTTELPPVRQKKGFSDDEDFVGGPQGGPARIEGGHDERGPGADENEMEKLDAFFGKLEGDAADFVRGGDRGSEDDDEWVEEDDGTRVRLDMDALYDLGAPENFRGSNERGWFRRRWDALRHWNTHRTYWTGANRGQERVREVTQVQKALMLGATAIAIAMAFKTGIPSAAVEGVTNDSPSVEVPAYVP